MLKEGDRVIIISDDEFHGYFGVITQWSEQKRAGWVELPITDPHFSQKPRTSIKRTNNLTLEFDFHITEVAQVPRLSEVRP